VFAAEEPAIRLDCEALDLAADELDEVGWDGDLAHRLLGELGFGGTAAGSEARRAVEGLTRRNRRHTVSIDHHHAR
jgi:hypothetical protein